MEVEGSQDKSEAEPGGVRGGGTGAEGGDTHGKSPMTQ